MVTWVFPACQGAESANPADGTITIMHLTHVLEHAACACSWMPVILQSLWPAQTIDAAAQLIQHPVSTPTYLLSAHFTLPCAATYPGDSGQLLQP